MPEDVFEQFTEDYNRWFDEHRDDYRAELARVRHLLSNLNDRAIEVGVGSGRIAAPLGITIGIEPSRAPGRMARERVLRSSVVKQNQSQSGTGHVHPCS